MKRHKIGEFRHRLQLEQSATVPDGGGGYTISWNVIDTVWAVMAPIAGEERLLADALSGRVTHRITVRHRRDLKPSMRLRQDDRIFEIRAVLDAYPYSPLVCLCEERPL